MVVTKQQLTAMLSWARSSATSTVETVGGDLSWLIADKELLLALRKERPHLHIRIFYEGGRISADARVVMDELRAAGVGMIPYAPNPFSVRCLVLDADSADLCRVFVYPRASSQQADGAQMFRWYELDVSDVAAKIVVSHLSYIKRGNSRVIKVGLSGANNVGKTTLANRLLESLVLEGLSASLVPDQFREVEDPSSYDGNVRILFRQVISEDDSVSAVCILDRTLADNLCFLKVRGQDGLYQTLAPMVASSMKCLDLIVDVKNTDEKHAKDTTHVTAEERRRLRRSLEDFYSTYGIPRMSVEINHLKFKESMTTAKDACLKAIKERFPVE